MANRVLDWIEVDRREGCRLGRVVIMTRVLNQYQVTNADWKSVWRQITILVEQELRHNATEEEVGNEIEIPSFVDDGEEINYILSPDGVREVRVEVIGTSCRGELRFCRKRSGIELVEGERTDFPSHVLDTARRVAKQHLTQY